MKLSILELIGTPNGIIQKFGLIVFERVEEALKKNPTQNIELSFVGLKNATTGFFNASIGNLYQKFGEETDKKIKITGLEDNKDWVEKFNDAKELGLNPDKVKKVDSIIAELFQ